MWNTKQCGMCRPQAGISNVFLLVMTALDFHLFGARFVKSFVLLLRVFELMEAQLLREKVFT